MFQLIMAQYELNVTDWKREGIFVTGETGDATHAQIREFRMQFISNNFLDLCFIYSVLLFIHTDKGYINTRFYLKLIVQCRCIVVRCPQITPITPIQCLREQPSLQGTY